MDEPRFDTPNFELVATFHDSTQSFVEALVILEASRGGGVRITGWANPVIEGTMFAGAASFSSTVRHAGATIIAAHTPASSSEVCLAGQVAWDASFHYVCIAANVWKRTALESW